MVSECRQVIQFVRSLVKPTTASLAKAGCSDGPRGPWLHCYSSAMSINCLRSRQGRCWPYHCFECRAGRALDRGFRGRIIVNAHRINQGLMPDLAPIESGDFHFVDAVA